MQLYTYTSLQTSFGINMLALDQGSPKITVPNPDIDGREKIIKIYLSKIKYIDTINVRVIARGTPGFSGAELANLVNEAALLAARKNKKMVDISDLESAKDKVLMGAERRSMAMSEEQKNLTAYHEGGHAIVSLYVDASDPIHKATIIPRGGALGMVMRLPEDDRFSLKKDKMLSDIEVAMGGRVAEEIIFGSNKISSGASSDIKNATKMARAMVTEWGLSDKVGPVYHGFNEDLYASHNNNNFRSEYTAQLIDQEVKAILEQGYSFAKTILTTNIDKLHILAKALLEYETLTGEQIRSLIFDKKEINIETDINNENDLIDVDEIEEKKNIKKKSKTSPKIKLNKE